MMPMHHRQPQARAFAHGFGGEEWIKDAFQRGAIHAAARCR